MLPQPTSVIPISFTLITTLSKQIAPMYKSNFLGQSKRSGANSFRELHGVGVNFGAISYEQMATVFSFLVRFSFYVKLS